MSTDRRDQIAEAIRPMIGRVHEPLRSDITAQWADTLLPMIDRLCAEAAAEALGKAAEWALVAVNWPHGGDVADELDRRATALTVKTGS